MARIRALIAGLLVGLLAASAHAQVAISALPAASTPLVGTEVVPAVQSGVTKKATVSSISNIITGTANSWSGLQTFNGGIVGTGVVNSPSASSAGDLACFSTTTGKVIVDCQTYGHGNASALSGSETILGIQSAAQVKITPAQLATYSGGAITETGPYTSQVAQTITQVANSECINIFSYLSAAQQAAVRAGTSVQDFGPIVLAASTAATFNSAGPCIFLPAGLYPVATPIELKAIVHIKGAGGGGGLAGTSSATTLQFAANITGITINRHNTLSGGTVTSGGRADGSVIEDLAITNATSTWTNPDLHPGIWLRARAVIRNVNVSWSAGNCVQIIASMGAGGATEGNANEWRLDNVNCSNAASGQALKISGADTNGGQSVAFGVQTSGLGGIIDSEFLGSNFSGSHIDSVASLGLGRVTHAGHNYTLISPTAGIGASTTPGTNGNVWQDDGVGSGLPAWSGAGSYFPSNAILSTGANTRSVHTGMYIEVGLPTSVVLTPSMVIGGNLQTEFSNSSVVVHSGSGVGGIVFANPGMGSFRYLAAAHAWGTYAYSSAQYDGLHVNSSAAYDFRLGLHPYTGEAWAVNTASLDIPLVITAPSTGISITYGRTAGCRSCVSFNEVTIGSGLTDSRVVGNATSIPSTTGYGVGEIRFNRTPSTSAPMGWMLGTQGAPDTWVAMPSLAGSLTTSGYTMATGRLVGRTTASAGATEEISVGNGLTLSGGSLTVNGVGIATGITSTSASAGIGYATGAGGTVTQITSRTTTVVVNKPTGAITLFSAAGSATPFSFTVTNSTVAATDTIVASIKSGTDKYRCDTTAVGAGSFELTCVDLTGTTVEQPVINFNTIKGVTSMLMPANDNRIEQRAAA